MQLGDVVGDVVGDAVGGVVKDVVARCSWKMQLEGVVNDVVVM